MAKLVWAESAQGRVIDWMSSSQPNGLARFFLKGYCLAGKGEFGSLAPLVE